MRDGAYELDDEGTPTPITDRVWIRPHAKFGTMVTFDEEVAESWTEYSVREYRRVEDDA